MFVKQSLKDSCNSIEPLKSMSSVSRVNASCSSTACVAYQLITFITEDLMSQPSSCCRRNFVESCFYFYLLPPLRFEPFCKCR